MKKIFLGAAFVVVAGIGACNHLLPERFAVNAPVAAMMFGRSAEPPPPTAIEMRMRVPEGFHIALYADSIPNVRWLLVTPAGDLLASQPRKGRVVLLRLDEDGDGRADSVDVLIEDLDRPHGMEFHDGWLYIAETNALGRIRFDPETRKLSGEFERILTGIPGGGNHWSRTVRLGPDGWMYLSIGSSCNVCDEKDPLRATMIRVRPDGSGRETHATGLRNSAGFDWQPGTDHLYATDNGRDLLGDDFPPCELNHIERGGFYGWPIANGDRVPDPDFGEGEEQRIAASIPPAHDFRAHNAPLGMVFLRNASVPAEYRGAALVALHGSWNRTEKDGYKVVSLHWDPDGTIRESDFATGFEKGGDVIGRPVDVAEGTDGTIYISDDYAGVVWRVSQQRP